MFVCSNTARRSLLAAIVVCLSSAVAVAQEPGTTLLEGIIIEAGNLALEPTRAEQLGSAVTVVSAAQIKAQQVRHAGDALRMVPGVSVSRTGSLGGLTQVRLRGSEANHVLVMIDGIKANDTPTGAFDFSDLLADDIERIEVIRGPQSGLWGSNALGGVINIVTKRGKGPARVTASVEAGSFDTRRVAMSARGGSEKAWGAVSFGASDTNGFDLSPVGSERDPARIVNFSARGGLRFSPFISVYGSIRALNKQFGFDDFGTPPGAVPGSPVAQIQVDGDNTGKKRSILGAATVQLDLLAKRWVHKLTGSLSKGDDDAIQPGFTFEAGSARRRVTYATRYSFDTGAGLAAKHTLSGLAEREWEHFDTSNTFAPAAINRARTMNSFAAEYSAAIAEALFLKAAARHDDSSAFGTFTTWSLSGAYKIAATRTRLHASAGTGVVFPTMFEQFGEFPGFFTPNPDLLPETSFGWDAGLEQKLFAGALVVDVTYFEQDLEQEIFSTFSGPPRNLDGRSLRKGVEVTARLRPMQGLEILASYTYLDAKEPDGSEEIRRPKHKASLEAFYRFNDGKGTLGVGVIYNGRMKDVTTDAFTFAAGRATLDDYTLLRLTGQYKVSEVVEIFGRVENVLDQDYREIFGIATPGLAAYAGLRLRFDAERAVQVAR